jgi:type IV secretory pathway VirB10-like protein
LRDQVAEGEVSPDTFVSGMRRRLSKTTAVTAHFVPAIEHPALEPGARRDASPSAPPVASPAPAATAVHPAPPSPEPSVVALPVAPPQRLTMADEDQMSEQDRRRIQLMLATMGYYSGRIDGTFGPETRAAIRRYQFEIKSEMTGRLSAEQATRLANSVR